MTQAAGRAVITSTQSPVMMRLIPKSIERILLYALDSPGLASPAALSPLASVEAVIEGAESVVTPAAFRADEAARSPCLLMPEMMVWESRGNVNRRRAKRWLSSRGLSRRLRHTETRLRRTPALRAGASVETSHATRSLDLDTLIYTVRNDSSQTRYSISACQPA